MRAHIFYKTAKGAHVMRVVPLADLDVECKKLCRRHIEAVIKRFGEKIGCVECGPDGWVWWYWRGVILERGNR